MIDHNRDAEVMDALARVVLQVAPPPGLRARVLANVQATTPAERLQKGRSTILPWLVAAAAVVLAAVTSFGWLSARGEVTRLRLALGNLQREYTPLLNVRDDLSREREARERAGAILSARDVQPVSLKGVGPAGAAYARAYVSASEGLLFVADGLPTLAQGQTYQLWAIVDATPVNAGVFRVEPSGRAELVTDTRIASAQALAVTVEPAGGVPAPTGPQYLLGVVSN